MSIILSSEMSENLTSKSRINDPRIDNLIQDFLCVNTFTSDFRRIISKTQSHLQKTSSYLEDINQEMVGLQKIPRGYESLIRKMQISFKVFIKTTENFAQEMEFALNSIFQICKGQELIDEKIRDFEVRKKQYDHYDEKLDILYHKDGGLNKNAPKLSDQILRNEEKYRSAAVEYINMKEALLPILTQFHIKKEQEVVYCINKLLKLQAEYLNVLAVNSSEIGIESEFLSSTIQKQHLKTTVCQDSSMQSISKDKDNSVKLSSDDRRGHDKSYSICEFEAFQNQFSYNNKKISN